MADAVHSQVIFDGARNTVMKFTNVSDGTGEALVLKVNPALLNPNPGVTLKVRRVVYSVGGGSVLIYWAATVPQQFFTCYDHGDYLFRPESALPDDAGAGATGGLLFSTNEFSAGSTYTILLEMRKGVQLI